MIVLDSTNDSIQIVLDDEVATNEHQCFASWRDVTATAYTPGKTAVLTNGTTDVNLVPAPSASTYRVIDFISVYNNDTAAMSVYIKSDISGTEKTLWLGTLQPGETLEYTSQDGWRVRTALGKELAFYGDNVNIQMFTSGTSNWLKPTHFNPVFVTVVLYGGGGGGGGGGSNTGAVVRNGGCGGGGGARIERTYLASDLNDIESVTIGASGTVGSAGASGGNGGSGGQGGTTTFSSGFNLLSAYGGGGGMGGTASSAAAAGGAGGGLTAAGGTGTGSAATGGGPGSPVTPNGGCGANSFASNSAPITAEYGGGAGGGNTNVPAHAAGGNSLYAGCGGGHGGGANVTPALIAATAGGWHSSTPGTGTAPANGIFYGMIGLSGAITMWGNPGMGGNFYIGGTGGGGGGSTITDNISGGAGGAGGVCGGGGGGGGSGTNTGTGGQGGLGGVGRAYIVSW